jgi:hypothetical protein
VVVWSDRLFPGNDRVTLVVVKLSTLILVQSVGLVQLLLGSVPPKLSLIQQRKIDAAMALPPTPGAVSSIVSPADGPTVPPGIFAAQLDLAEEHYPTILLFTSAVDLELKPTSESSSIAARSNKVRVARVNFRYVSTNDIFNRSFGVFTVASR